MSLKIAENDLVELTWWDEFSSREHTEVSVYVEFGDGSGDLFIDVGGLRLSLQAWERLIFLLGKMMEEKGLQSFINNHKIVKDDVVVIDLCSSTKKIEIKPKRPSSCP